MLNSIFSPTLRILAGLISTLTITEMADAQSNVVYIGTYTGAKGRGIYISRFDDSTGKLTNPELAVETKNPSFLAINRKHTILYAVGETDSFEGKPTGCVSAFRIEPASGKLTLLNQQPSGGAGPCHLALDATGKCVLVANYSGGSIAVLGIRDDGSLAPPATTIQHHGSSIDQSRQTSPHAHYITADPRNQFALTCDLGLDQVLVYRLDPNKPSLTPNEPPFARVPPGAGARHLTFHPNGQFVYVINEMGSTITAFQYDSKGGTLRDMQTISTLPLSFKGESTCAEVQVHPSGKFVYGSNRGDDSIAAFAVAQKTGKLTSLGHCSTEGRTPRHFTLDPSGKWLLAENQDSDSIVVLRIDSKTGKLSASGQRVEVGAPVCALFVSTPSF